MRTSSPGADPAKNISNGKTVAAAGAFLCAALMLSLAESMLFPAGILPIPGAKPGLANAAVLMCACLMGLRYAAAVSFSRVILMFFLFGTGTSAIYSITGAALSFAGIVIFCKNRHLSFLGKSVIAAVLHNTAQTACAVFFFGLPALTLIPWMLLSAVLCGSFTGVILNLSYNTVYKNARRLIRNKK